MKPKKTRAPSRTRTTLVNLVFSYASLALLFVHGLVLTPLYLSVIPVPLYGAWLATGAILAGLELLDPGIGQILQQRTAHTLGLRERSRLRSVIGTGILVSLALALLLLAAAPLAGFAPLLVGYRGEGADELSRAFGFGIAASAAGIAAAGVSAAGIGLQLATLTGTSYVLGGILSIVVTVTLLRHGIGLPSLPLGLLARGLFVTVVNAAGILAWSQRELGGPPRPALAEAKALFAVSGFTFAARAGSSLLGRLDALVASWFFGPEQAAVIGITGRAADLVRIVVERLGQSVAPGLAHMVGEGSIRTGRTMTSVLLVASCLAAVGLGSVIAANQIFVGTWVGPGLYGGAVLSIALAATAGLAVIGSTCHQLLVATGALGRSSVLVVVEGATRLPLQIGLPFVLGLPGIPVAALTATALTLWVWMPRALDARVPIWAPELRAAMARAVRRVVFAVAAGSVLGLALSWAVQGRRGWWLLAGCALASALVQTALCLSGRAERTEVRRVLRHLSRAKKPHAAAPMAERIG